MRYVCTIYNQNQNFGTTGGTIASADSDAGGNGVLAVASVEVSGKDRRDAAARAWVQCVGRERARLLREQLEAPRRIIAQQTNCRAIAASLRKTTTGLGECYEMDNLVEGWFITVEPADGDVDAPRGHTLRSSRMSSRPAPTQPRRKPRRLRLPYPTLLRLLRSQSPN